MIKVLFLDDKKSRVEKFNNDGFSPVWTKSSADTIELLKKHYWDLVSLDYDLGGDDNGMKVVDWITKNRPSVGCVLVHSTNLLMALDMIHSLRGAGYFVRYRPIEVDLFER